MNMNNAKRYLGDMHAAEVRDLMMAERGGKTIQRYTDGWHDVKEECNWYLDNIYRVKPNIQLYIPWEVIDKKWQWVAMDLDGSVRLYSKEPTYNSDHGVWACSGDNCLVNNKIIINNRPNHNEWKNTLTKRPTQSLGG